MVPQTPLMSAVVLKEEEDTWMEVQVTITYEWSLKPLRPQNMLYVQKIFGGSNTDGSFTMSISHLFSSP